MINANKTNLFKIDPNCFSKFLASLCLKVKDYRLRHHFDLSGMKDQERKQWFSDNRAYSDALKDSTFVVHTQMDISRDEYEKYKDDEGWVNHVKERMACEIGRIIIKENKFFIEQWGDYRSQRLKMTVVILHDDVGK